MAKQAASDFPFLAPPSFLRRIGDNDALLRQVIPHPDEMLEEAGFFEDPLDEAAAGRDGLIEKFDGRLLVMATQTCAGHCRFCFRRHFLNVPADPERVQAAFRQRMEYSNDISEVIFSGGDPLMLSDQKLGSWFRLVRQYPQVRRIRIHTRVPVFLPERITPDLAALLTRSPLPIVLAVHVNHPDEIDSVVAERLSLLRDAGVMLLTQTVLLRGVNDSAELLAALFERAVEHGMVPYYLHQLDRVAGAAHFAVDKKTGLEIVRKLRQQLPGYMVPRYVEEVPGERSKLPVTGDRK